jgi:reversibly glycosylated polypeptide
MKTPKFTIAIVAPFHLPPKDSWLNAVNAITKETTDRKVIIVDDSKNQDLEQHFPEDFIVYNREQQKEEMGEELYKKFTQFHKSSACKNFGHWIAWRDKFDIIMGLDSDCEPGIDFVGQHVEGLLKIAGGWTNVIEGTGYYPRGYPYQERMRRTIANMGLWAGLLDIGGKDRDGKEPTSIRLPKPHMIADGFTTFSGMNWAVWADAIPGLLFLPNFDYKHKDKVYEFRRHDDIWGGYIFQKLMEKRNERIAYGEPIVFHNSPVDAVKDAQEEEGMTMFEGAFYGSVDQIVANVSSGEYEDMFREFAVLVEKEWPKTEWEPLVEPIKMWADLFT